MIPVLLALTGASWTVVGLLIVLVRRKPPADAVVPLGEEAPDVPIRQPDSVPFGHIWLHDGRYRVIQTTKDGRRARLMFERGRPGPGEVLEVYDGPHCRGRKEAP